MSRVIAIPPFFTPGSTQIAATKVSFELVNTAGQPIAGLTLVNGLVGRRDVMTTDSEQLIELECNEDLVPFSQWKVTVSSGLVVQTVQVTLAPWPGAPSDEIPLPLADLLYPPVS